MVPEHFAVATGARQHPRDHEQQIGQAVEIADGFRPHGIMPGQPKGGMKLFLDHHHAGPGKVTADAVGEAHKKDLATQDKHGVNFLSYWVDEADGNVFCLVEGPSADAVKAAHKEAHGMVPDKVSEVTPGS